MIFLPLKKFVTTLNFVRPNIITKLGRIFFLGKKKSIHQTPETYKQPSCGCVSRNNTNHKH